MLCLQGGNDGRRRKCSEMPAPVPTRCSCHQTFRNAAVGRRFAEPLRPATFTCDVAHDILSVSSGVQTSPYLSHDLACASQAVCPGGQPNSANAQTCESFASKSGARMSSMRAPADYRIQKMRAAEESSRQMNAYVKVRTTAMTRVPFRIALGANATPPARMLTIESNSAPPRSTAQGV